MTSRMGLMLDRCMQPESIPVLVDLGSVNDKASRNCADRMIAAGVKRRNFSIEGFNRLLVKLPQKIAPTIIKRFRLKADAQYWQCTHRRSTLKS